MLPALQPHAPHPGRRRHELHVSGLLYASLQVSPSPEYTRWWRLLLKTSPALGLEAQAGTFSERYEPQAHWKPQPLESTYMRHENWYVLLTACMKQLVVTPPATVVVGQPTVLEAVPVYSVYRPFILGSHAPLT